MVLFLLSWNGNRWTESLHFLETLFSSVKCWGPVSLKTIEWLKETHHRYKTIYGKAHGIMQINQNKWNCDRSMRQILIIGTQMKLSGNAGHKLATILYFNFNCTITWILTYLVLLDPKDQTITFKTQKYLIKSMPVILPVPCHNDNYAIFKQSCSHHIHSDHMTGDLLETFHQLLMCTWYIFYLWLNGIKQNWILFN